MHTAKQNPFLLILLCSVVAFLLEEASIYSQGIFYQSLAVIYTSVNACYKFWHRKIDVASF